MANSKQKLAASLTLPADRDILVCIFQRGAADGLNAVVPYGDDDYYTLRDTIAVPKPVVPPVVNPNAAIKIDNFYGLHPALAPLKPIYDSNNLAIGSRYRSTTRFTLALHGPGSGGTGRGRQDRTGYRLAGTAHGTEYTGIRLGVSHGGDQRQRARVPDRCW